MAVHEHEPRVTSRDVLRELTLAIAGMALVAALDWVTGPLLSVSVFYLLPIARVAWTISARVGYLCAGIGAGIWMTIDLMTQPEWHVAISAWNMLVRLAFFVIVVALLDRTRKLTAQQRAMAFIDPLTQLGNSRAFRARLELELARQQRAATWLTVAYLDLDHFKQVNDVHGHDRGDEVLRIAAQEMASSLRSTDLLARIGGDEFALLLPETDEAGARAALEAVRARLLAAMCAGNWPVSASIGAVSFERAPDGAAAVLRQADALMYSVKRDGRDGIACLRCG